MQITKKDIFRFLRNRTYYDRGLSYFKQGKVLTAETSGTDFAFGQVQGSGRKRYRVEVDLQRGSGERLTSINGDCTCPIGYNCKHVAALLLKIAEKTGGSAPELLEPLNTGPRRTGNGEITAEDVQAFQKNPAKLQEMISTVGLSAEVKNWLETVGKAPEVRPEKSRFETAQSKTSVTRVFYVFRRNRKNRVEIVPVKAYVKKDGSFGKSIKECDWAYGFPDNSNIVTLEDALIAAEMGYFKAGYFGGDVKWPPKEQLSNFLRRITVTGRARGGALSGPVLHWTGPKQVAFTWEADDSGVQRLVAREASGEGKDGDGLLILPFPDPVFIDEKTGDTGFAETGLGSRVAQSLAMAPDIPAEGVEAVSHALIRLVLTPNSQRGNAQTPHVRTPQKSGAGSGIPLPMKIEREERTGLSPLISLKLFGYRQYGETYPCVRLDVGYEGYGKPLSPGAGPHISYTDQGKLVLIKRNFDEEADHLDYLLSLIEAYGGLLTDGSAITRRMPKAIREAHGIFPPVTDQYEDLPGAALNFMSVAVPEMRSKGWRIETDPSWPYVLYEGEIDFETGLEKLENDWFSLKLSVEADGVSLNLTPAILQIVRQLPLDEAGELAGDFDLKAYLDSIILYQKRPDDSLMPIPATRLLGFVEAFLEVQGLTHFHMAEAGQIRVLAEALDGCGAPWRGGPEILELGKRLQGLTAVGQAEIPPSLKAELRPYQKLGYGWLKALSESGFGGILADDMGLGKTVQTLGLLALRHLESPNERPSLLVVPTSLIGNWQSEAKRFTPGLKLLVLHGPDRHKDFEIIKDHDLVITTYPLVNRDYATLFEHEFDLAILDEAQAVKNPTATVAKRIRHIKAQQRLALTGTPLENNLTELWSLYDWLIPGLLGDRKSFNLNYRKPIEQDGNGARQKLLSTRVKPFLMRRTKDEVAKDLPPKTVIDEKVTLRGAQAALYESVRQAMDARVRKAIASKGLSGSRITVIDALLKLRQVCCDPKLVKLASAAKVKDSAKRERLFEILEGLMSEGRKILIFSQFVEMLRLIESDVQTRGWSYSLLHGRTKDRASEIGKFQSGQSDLFLISLKAGGTGLNLTAADTVILYDPWWNPAVERQAMDRAHRIGQDKPVFVHRLFAADTVETAIQTMQARKQALADSLFDKTEGGPMSLSEDDLAAFFGG